MARHPRAPESLEGRVGAAPQVSGRGGRVHLQLIITPNCYPTSGADSSLWGRAVIANASSICTGPPSPTHSAAQPLHHPLYSHTHPFLRQPVHAHTTVPRR